MGFCGSLSRWICGSDVAAEQISVHSASRRFGMPACSARTSLLGDGFRDGSLGAKADLTGHG
jgi:hypothetical protein